MGERRGRGARHLNERPLGATSAVALAAALCVCLADEAQAAPACPGKTFDAFLEAFLASSEVQRRFTADPLTTSHLSMDMVDPRPMAMVEQEALARLRFPLLPNRREQAGLGYGMEVSRAASARPVVVIGSGADRRRYSFERTSCWRLVRLDDESL